MGRCIKTLSYISAAIHVLLNLIGIGLASLICVWYRSDSRKQINKESGLTDTPFWIFIVLAIYFVFGLLSTISLIFGIRNDTYKLFHVFFSSMIIIILLFAIRAFTVLAGHITDNYPPGTVALEFSKDIGYCVFIIIAMTPCFILYEQLAGQSYLQKILSHCLCCGKKYKRSLVPNAEV